MSSENYNSAEESNSAENSKPGETGNLQRLEKARLILTTTVLGMTLAMLLVAFFTSPDFSSSVIEAISPQGDSAEVSVQKDLPYISPPDNIRRGDMYFGKNIPSSKHSLYPAVVIVHGGSWTKGSNQDIEIRSISQYLAKLGYRSFAINFRLNGTGGEFPNDIRDINSALCYIEKNADKFNIDANLIFLLGTSSGATSCLTAAYGRSNAELRNDASCTPNIKAVAAFSAPTNLQNEIENPYLAQYLHAKNGKPNKEDISQASPMSYVQTAVPTILLHGTADKNVSINESYELAKRLEAQKTPVAMINIEGQAHFIGAESRKQALDIVNKFFMDVVRKQSKTK